MKVILIHIIILISFTSFSQRTIDFYYELTYKYMERKIDSSVMKKIICYDYMAKGLDNKRYAGDYSTDKQTILYNLEWIGFFYQYYSKELNYTFHWYLTIGCTNDSVLPAKMITNTFPDCILKNEPCHLLSRDEAIKLAIADSIANPDNIYVEFCKPNQSNDFFWAVSGMPKRFFDYNAPPKKGVDPPIPYWQKGKTKLINAYTGKIIPLGDYYRMDKD